jgi:hypothetical protein
VGYADQAVIGLEDQATVRHVASGGLGALRDTLCVSWYAIFQTGCGTFSRRSLQPPYKNHHAN